GIRALDLRPQVAAQTRTDAVQWDERRVADALEDRAARALAHELRAETGHAERLAGSGLDPNGIQRATGETERFVGVAACLRGSDRCESSVALRLLGEPGRARKTFASAGEISVLHVEGSRVVERARHLVQKTEVLVDVEALLIAHDRGLDVTTVVVRLRDAG